MLVFLLSFFFPCVGVCLCACVRAYVSVCIRACMYTCLGVQLHVCVYVCACVSCLSIKRPFLHQNCGSSHI